MSYKEHDVNKMHGVKLEEKLHFIQDSICKCRYEKLAVHLQWQRAEELGQVFLAQKCTF